MPEARPRRRSSPPGAAAREGLLRRYGLLGDRPDEELDALVGLAARCCGVSRAVLGVPDGERLLLRARCGVEPDACPLPSPLVERLLEAPAALVVSNIGADPRLSGDPLVMALAAEAVLGARVETEEGLVVGVLVVADEAPRSFDAAALGSLRTVARQVAAVLDLRRLRARLGSSSARRPSTGDFLRLSQPILEAGRHSVIEASLAVDEAGRIASFGPDAEAIFGIEAPAALGTPMMGLLVPARRSEADGVRKALARPLEAASGPFAVRARRADGSEFPAELTLAGIPRGRDTPLTSVHVRDVSGRRLLERALAASVVSRLDRGALLTSNPYPAEVCEAAVRTLWIMPEVDHCALFLLAASRRSLELAFWCGDPPRDARSRVPLDDPSLLARVARSGDRALGRRRRSPAPDGGIGRIEAALPLLAGGEVVGVLKLESASPVAFSPALLALCGSVASGIAAAFEGTNITELLLRAKVALERAFDAMPELVAILDGEGRIRRLNQAVADRLGRPVRDLVDEDFKALFPFTRDWMASAAGARGERPVWSELLDAERGVTWEVSLLELDSPSPLLGDRVVFLRDVTRDREMSRRMLAVEKRAAMGDLLTGVAHEVRNPLAAIQAAIDGLEREPETTLPPDDRALLGIIHRQVARLGSLMNNLLYIGKPLQNVAPEGHSLVQLCRSAVELWQESPIAVARSVELVIPEGESLPARCDRPRIEQVLLNLLDNAAQHSGARTSIRVELDRDGGDVRLRVSDAGRGLSGAAATRLFEPFFTTRDNGTGLGLALVKGIVEGHGGSVGAWNNQAGPGATFEVRLPASEVGG
jgi:PAS domain S-box-containing protein